MGLSPLHPILTSDLHVSTAADLHQDFSRLRPARAKITIFRVPLDVHHASPNPMDKETAPCATLPRQQCPRVVRNFTCIAPHGPPRGKDNGFASKGLAHSVVSMVRVTRRVDKGPIGQLRLRAHGRYENRMQIEGTAEKSQPYHQQNTRPSPAPRKPVPFSFKRVLRTLMAPEQALWPTKQKVCRSRYWRKAGAVTLALTAGPLSLGLATASQTV